MNNREKVAEILDLIDDGEIEQVKELITSDESLLDFVTPFGTWLHVAALEGQLELVKFLVELGMDFNINEGIPKSAPIAHAAGEGELSIVQYLLNQGAQLDVSDPGRNPLFSAIYGGHLDVVQYLVHSGIDLTVKYTGEIMKNTDAFNFALERGQLEIADYLKRKMIERGAEVVENDPPHEDEDVIFAQMVKYFGPVKNSIGELIPGSKVAVTIHVIPSSKEHPFTTLFTTGMSDEPMGYSMEEEAFKYAELLLKLPSDWPVEQDVMNDPAHFWPMKWLRMVAHIPHLYEGGLDEGVILPNGDPPQPFAPNTKLSCIMSCRPYESELDSIPTGQGDVNVFTLIPIYEEERMLALEKGHEYLLKRMREHGISDVLDIHRKNVGL
ncbi:ankyrin repeat family protein [Fictibacillus macauensis ZFHKF-1]|uniref:Ankyrin repeat family protein n=1 Tax=Fictibacillus macauensis ZFHKF-1 TaxID=1196324 RepID=I8AMK6_9BACL|nr:suppressor of fused domain protein [Fictibacillus macauensis]EIT87222.1 ankyrin repeat family protein [Fictibacillus macauensis ZFHKF-1]